MDPEFRPHRERISPDEFLFLSRQLASFARMGLPLRDGLSVMAREADTPAFRRVCTTIAGDLEQGMPLADSLARFPRIFSLFYVVAVRAGEQSGNLAGCMEALSDHFRATFRWRRVLVGLLIYPVFIVLAFVPIIFFLLTCIMPRYILIFDALNVPLPPITRIVLWASFVSGRYWLWAVADFFGLLLILALICRYYRRTVFYSAFVLNLPLIGSLARKSAIQLFCQMLLTLLRGGMSLAPALHLMSQAFGRNVFGRAVADLHDAVAEGEGMGAQCRKCGLFPESIAWKISVMEERGVLEEGFADLSADLSTDVEVAVQNVSRMILPTAALVVGAVVFTIVLATFLPIVKLQQVMTGG